MSNHNIIKVRKNEAAIVFKNDGKVDMVNPEGGVLHRDCAPAFALCYAVSMHKYLYKKVCNVISNELKEKNIAFKTQEEADKFDQFINMLSNS